MLELEPKSTETKIKLMEFHYKSNLYGHISLDIGPNTGHQRVPPNYPNICTCAAGIR